MAYTKNIRGSNLSEKVPPETNFRIKLYNDIKTKKRTKMKHNISSGRNRKKWVTNPESATAPDLKPIKNRLLNRNEVCDLMLWSQDELTWYINHQGLPTFGNKFSRSAIRDWESTNLQMCTAS